MKLTRLFAIGVFAGSLAMASTSVPGIVSTTHIAGTSFSTADGVFTRSAPSASNLGGGTGISLNQPQIWFERQLFVPNLGGAGGTRVDWLAGADALGTSYNITASASLGGSIPGPTTALNTTRVLPTGTSVYSYYFYSNRTNAGTAGNSGYAASITFSLPILGVIVNNQTGVARLNNTNATFGRAGVTNYNTASSAGFDGGQNDRFRVQQITATQYRLSFQLANNGFDSFRVLTATPEPATWAAFGLIAITLLLAVRRQRGVVRG